MIKLNYIALHLVFVFQVQEVSTSAIGEEIENTKDSSGNVGSTVPMIRSRPGRQLANKRNEVQARGQGSIDQLLKIVEQIKMLIICIKIRKQMSKNIYRQNPMDGDCEDLTDAQQVHKGPQKCGNEGGYCHKQEEMCRSSKGR